MRVGMSLLAGMQVGEIAALKVMDAYEADGTVKSQIRLAKHQTKGSEARTVLLNAQQVARYSTNHGCGARRIGKTKYFRSRKLPRKPTRTASIFAVNGAADASIRLTVSM